MRRRDVFYVAFFTAIAAVGFINVATGGLMNHLAVEYSPYHSHGEAEIDSNEIIISGDGSADFTVENMERFTYSMGLDSENISEMSPVPNFDFDPSPRTGYDSLPPTYRWNFQTPAVEASVSFDTSDVEPGTYNYTLKASGGSHTAEEDLTLVVE